MSPVPLFLVIPFILLLSMIATGPVLCAKWWHRHYVHVALLLAAFVLIYYIGVLHDLGSPIIALSEYIQFIALIGSLYIASSGILIRINKKVTPLTNLTLLWVGAVLANVIGTTGASMLLIRPYIHLNGARIRPYHILFFIFMVSNIGGALTPIGDPPLFLGFLKGVPFFWTLTHALAPWLLALSLLSLVFYIIDKRNTLGSNTQSTLHTTHKKKIQMQGLSNLIFLCLIVGAVFLDPHVLEWVPAISYHGHHFSFVRELLLFAIGMAAYHKAERKIWHENGFSLEPLKEVVFIFIGIFFTMMPALAHISHFARSAQGQALITPLTLYWGTGLLSGVLDNAPTYLNFLAAGMGAKGLSLENLQDVLTYTKTYATHLRATSIAAVFFGAMTYVGNGPNFMIRAIALEKNIEMPSFGGYIFRYSIPILLPILALVGLLFFTTTH